MIDIVVMHMHMTTSLELWSSVSIQCLPQPPPNFFFHLNPQPLLALPVSQPYNPYLLVFLPVIIEK